VLLIELRKELSPLDIILFIWVFAIFVEEIRQVCKYVFVVICF